MLKKTSSIPITPPRGHFMIKNITHLTLLVKNQDDALDFFTKKLGFELHTDVMFGEMRWLTVNPEGNKQFEITLMLPPSEQAAQVIGKQAGDMIFACFSTDNCQALYESFKKNGVETIGEPTQEPWGTQMIFKDLYGNSYLAVQQ